MAGPTNFQLADFPFQSHDKIRYADTDRQGHINNATFSNYLETGRVEFLLDPARPLTAEDASFVIANLNLSFVAEVNWPGQIDIGTAVKKLGNSSITLLQQLFQDGTLVASAETVIVQMNNASRRSQALPEDSRAFLARHQL